MGRNGDIDGGSIVMDLWLRRARQAPSLAISLFCKMFNLLLHKNYNQHDAAPAAMTTKGL
jgi:hypothetical protein